MKSNKLYILDTNVLLHDPQALFNFDHAHVGIPIMVIEELDHFKEEHSSRGYNARRIINTLDLLRERGSLAQGVPLDNQGNLRILFEEVPAAGVLGLFDNDEPDNHILRAALYMKGHGFEVELVSKDLNMRVKADLMGIPAADYVKDKVDREEFYKGWITVQAPAVQLKKEQPDILTALQEEYPLSLNEFVIVESQHNPFNYRLFRYKGPDQFVRVEKPDLKWPIEMRNVQQIMALNLLLDPAIQLITLLGPAGTGKTFITLVAALYEILVKEEYDKILVSRPVIPLGRDIGFLPGEVHEKLHSWMQPIYDNMDYIVHLANSVPKTVGIYREEGLDERPDKKNKYRNRKLQREKNLPGLDELIKRGKISLEAITYMRGRSIPYQFIFIDEVQNLTPHEVKTLISRVGEGSKIVLAGDPYQIDSPYLDFASNGLVVASQRFKGQKIFGTVFLETSERSELSRLAGTLL
jgi:PhoH-like ATPase